MKTIKGNEVYNYKEEFYLKSEVDKQFELLKRWVLLNLADNKVYSLRMSLLSEIDKAKNGELR